MVCGVHLGILLAVFCQAEYVRCSWATQAQSSQRQNSNGYVGLSQQDSELERLGASDPQNGLRQASVSHGLTQKRSINSPSGSSYSQPAQSPPSSFSSGRFVRRDSVSALNGQKQMQVNEPKKFFGLSTAIASGSSLSKYNKRPTDRTVSSRRTTRPVQQSAREYSPRSSASLHTPSRSSSTFSSTYDGQGGSSLSRESFGLFSPRASSSQRHSVRMQTSATAPARRVSIRRTSKVSRPSTFLPSKKNPEQSSHAASQPRSLQRYSSTSTGSQESSWNRSPAQGAQYQPPPGSDGTRYAPSRVYSIPEKFGGFDIRRLGDSVEQKVSATEPLDSYITSSGPIVLLKPQAQSYTAQVQGVNEPVQTHTASSANVVQKPQAQSYTAPSAQAVSYKPQVQSVGQPPWTHPASSAHSVVHKPQVQTVRKPQQTQVAPPAQMVSYKPKQSFSAPSAQTVVYKPQVYSERKPAQKSPSDGRDSYNPQQSYTSQSAQTVSSKPQVQTVDESAQTHTASTAYNVVHRPQVQTIRKPQQTQVAPPAQILSYKPQHTFTAPSEQVVSYKPQVQTDQPAQTHLASSGYNGPCKFQVQTVGKLQQTVPLLSFKPQQTDTAPSAQAGSYKPQVQSERTPQQVHVAPSAQIVSYKPQGLSAQTVLFKPQQTDIAPSTQTSYEPQVQTVRKPQQTLVAPSAQAVPHRPQVYSGRKQEVQAIPPEGRESSEPQQTLSAPSAQTFSSKPKVQTVQEPARWKRITLNKQLKLQQMQRVAMTEE